MKLAAAMKRVKGLVEEDRRKAEALQEVRACVGGRAGPDGWLGVRVWPCAHVGGCMI